MYRVVIADDEPLIRLDIKDMLEQGGYEVVGDAVDGFDAVELCREHKPDFVILDIKMPIIDGLEAAKIIQRERLAGFIIILTAYSDQSMIDRAIDQDVMAFLVKPISAKSLIPAIELAIHKQKKISRITDEYNEAKRALEMRKLVDRAKGILIQKKNLSEEEAYHYIRKAAMDKECTMAQIAKAIIMANQ